MDTDEGATEKADDKTKVCVKIMSGQNFIINH